MVDDSEPKRDLVVIGASAGGLEVVRRIVAALPPGFPAAVCIVLHISPQSPSALAPILNRAGRLPCRAARDGEALRRGEILVAPPDRHLIVEDGRVRVTVDPRENGHRPAVDPLFRSAAVAAGPRAIGVIVSGTRDDGAAGLAAIKAAGGATLVQDPKEALYAGMPTSALANAPVDAVATSDQLGPMLMAMVKGDDLPPSSHPSASGAGAGPSGDGFTTVCPDCGGVLSERHVEGVAQWQCRVGHRYSADSLVDAQGLDVEEALWVAVRVLEDRRMLLERMAARAERLEETRSARSFNERAAAAGEQARAVRRALGRAAESTLRSIEADEDESAA
jgi:two-component system chemotaxis response regulator CheB